MSIIGLFFKNVKQGLRTGVYGGAFGQTVAIVVFVFLVMMGGALAKGFITFDDLRSDPVGSVYRTFEPTVRSIVDRDSADEVPADTGQTVLVGTDGP
jgi:nitrate/nitrite transporter NarK